MKQPIFESSVLSQNKNTFNKISSELKVQLSKVSSDKKYKNSANYEIVFGDKYYNLVFDIEYTFMVKDIILHEDSDKIYFLTNCRMVPIYLKITNGHIYGRNEYEEYIKKYVTAIVKQDPNDWYYSFMKDTIEKFEKDGFSIDHSKIAIMTEPQIDNLVVTSTPYKKLMSLAKDIMSTDMDTVLHPKCLPRLKLRNNVVPVAWYDKNKDEISSPHEPREYNAGIMATKYRYISSLENFIAKDIKDKSRRAVKYTPYDSWVLLDTDKLNFDDCDKTKSYDFNKRRYDY